MRISSDVVRRLSCWVAALLAAACSHAQAENVMVAVAANFAAPMREIKAAFEQASGHRVVMVLGSTGSLYAQVRNGAPFHLLLAADEKTPRRLESEGLAVTGTRWTYANGRLALWSATPGRVGDQGALRQPPTLGKIAIANPALAPYGAAAFQVMERTNLLPAWRQRLVLGESVGQAYQFVASANADVGFVALAQVMRAGRIDKGSAWVVPATMHDPIRQDAVLLNPGRERAGALALQAFLSGPTARAIIRDHGYDL